MRLDNNLSSCVPIHWFLYFLGSLFCSSLITSHVEFLFLWSVWNSYPQIITLVVNEVKFFTIESQQLQSIPSKVICDCSSKVRKNGKEGKQRQEESEWKTRRQECAGWSRREIRNWGQSHNIMELPSYKGSALKLQALQRETVVDESKGKAFSCLMSWRVSYSIYKYCCTATAMIFLYLWQKLWFPDFYLLLSEEGLTSQCHCFLSVPGVTMNKHFSEVYFLWRYLS